MKLLKKISQPIGHPDGSPPLPAVNFFAGIFSIIVKIPMDIFPGFGMFQLFIIICDGAGLFHLYLLARNVKSLFLRTHSAPFLKKEKEKKPLKIEMLNGRKTQDEGGTMMMKSGCVGTPSWLVQKTKGEKTAAAAVPPAVFEGTTSMSSSFSVVVTSQREKGDKCVT